MHGILVEGVKQDWVVGELLADFGLSHTKGLEENRDRLFTLAVHANAHHVALIDFELEPRTTRRNDLHVVDQLIRGLVGRFVEVHPWRTHHLGDNNTFGAVDDERTLGVISGKSPMKVVCDLISPVS